MPGKLVSLGDLAKQINSQHKQCVAAASFAITSAIEVGKLLTEAKGRVKHGEWLAWVDSHCEFKARQAQNYMAAFEHRELIEERMRTSGAYLEGLHGALELIREPRTVEVVRVQHEESHGP